MLHKPHRPPAVTIHSLLMARIPDPTGSAHAVAREYFDVQWSPMSPPREIELKLDVPIHSLQRLVSSSLLKGADASARKPASLVSTYFDTKTLKLRHKQLSLRVRRIGRRLVQTVKQ